MVCKDICWVSRGFRVVCRRSMGQISLRGSGVYYRSLVKPFWSMRSTSTSTLELGTTLKSIQNKVGDIIVRCLHFTKIVYIPRFATLMHGSGLRWRRSWVIRSITRVKRVSRVSLQSAHVAVPSRISTSSYNEQKLTSITISHPV